MESIFDNSLNKLNAGLGLVSGVTSLKYEPKGSVYIIKEFCQIKQPEGDWVEGVIYYDQHMTNDLYCRPLYMFTIDKWSITTLLGG